MPIIHGLGHAAVAQGQTHHLGRRIEEQPDVVVEGALIPLDRDQIVAAGILHLLAERSLAKQGVPRQHAVPPANAVEQGRGHGQLGLAPVRIDRRRDGFLRQHHARGMAEGAERVHRTAAAGEAQAAALGLAINGPPLPLRRCGHRTRREAGGQRRREGRAVQLGKEPLHR